MAPFTSLDRFLQAQAPVWPQVQAELHAGRKRTHWMWFVFPQLAGLGHSEMARRYAIASAAEARAYLDHPELGQRLRACCDLLLQQEGRSAHDILGSPDDVKLRSSMTLFSQVAAPEDTVFAAVLHRYFGGQPDPLTLERLAP
ncbi:DUF1810 domain-containing protein [Acidovorax sp. Leaf160]|uniref:DUF1810 domain-containing protein n=1 Tax=Acidovorax sp. Leaf160 TaxID=1736280 RepID=UPI0006F9F322|nr:DUF1810 domain-containing protein [Acidovorax sp. Leaf160]KQR57975.1 calpastatin [Acidovorax sp. Leaf160]